MSLYDGSFIEIALWNKTSFLQKLLRIKPIQVPCIRYDKDFYVCLIDGYPEFVRTKKLELTKFERKNMKTECVEKGKRYLLQLIKDKKFFLIRKEFLKDYMRIFNSECISV